MEATIIWVIFSAAAVLANPTPIQPTKIGQTGEKTFYEIKSLGKVTWMDAKDACASADLEFGQTDNEIEFNYLYNQRPKTDYWIAASQKGLVDEDGSISDFTHKTFQWTDGSELPLDINFIQKAETWLCLYVTGEHHTFVSSCLKSKHNVLCQSTE